MGKNISSLTEQMERTRKYLPHARASGMPPGEGQAILSDHELIENSAAIFILRNSSSF
jgi:hypothetical protein